MPAGEKGKGVEQTGCGAHPGFSPASDSCNTYKIPGGDGHPPTIGYNMGGGANNWPLVQLTSFRLSQRSERSSCWQAAWLQDLEL